MHRTLAPRVSGSSPTDSGKLFSVMVDARQSVLSLLQLPLIAVSCDRQSVNCGVNRLVIGEPRYASKWTDRRDIT